MFKRPSTPRLLRLLILRDASKAAEREALARLSARLKQINTARFEMQRLADFSPMDEAALRKRTADIRVLETKIAEMVSAHASVEAEHEALAEKALAAARLYDNCLKHVRGA